MTSTSSIAPYSNYLTNYSQSIECKTLLSHEITDEIVTINSGSITGVLDPINGTDAANKGYTDSHPPGSAVSGQDTWIQYNNMGAFGSTSDLVFDGTTVTSSGIYIGNAYSAVIQDLTYYSLNFNSSVTIQYIGGGVAGSEIVTATNSTIVVQIDNSVSTGTNVLNAIRNTYASFNLVSVVVSGAGNDPQTVQGPTSLTLASTLDTGISINNGRITGLTSAGSGYNQNYVSKIVVDSYNTITPVTISGTGSVTYTKNQFYNSIISRSIPGTGTVVDTTPSALKLISNTISGTNQALYALVASTTNLSTLSGTSITIDGVVVNSIGSRVLLKNQLNKVQNGLWSVNSSTWTRPLEFSTGSNCSGYNIWIQQGALAANTEWTCTSTSPAIVDTNQLTFARSQITLNSSFGFTIDNISTSAILQISPGASITFDPTSLSSNYIYPGYCLNTQVLVTSVLAGSESAKVIATSLLPTFQTSNFSYGPRSLNNTVANTLIKNSFTFNTKPTINISSNLTYTPVNVLGLLVRKYEGVKVDAFGAVSSFISGFSVPNSPITYVFDTGAFIFRVKNGSTTGTLTIIPSLGWTMDPNSNMTIPPGKIGTFYVYIDTINLLGNVYVISIV